MRHYPGRIYLNGVLLSAHPSPFDSISTSAIHVRVGAQRNHYTFDILITENSGTLAVADPGFPRGGCANPRGETPRYYLTNFPENCMSMKKFWPRNPPPRSTSAQNVTTMAEENIKFKNYEGFNSRL